MRIDRIYIDGFGHFEQTTFGPFGSQVTIFEGENESGKTTLLAFIRTVLYGFPGRGGAEPGAVQSAAPAAKRRQHGALVEPRGGRKQPGLRGAGRSSDHGAGSDHHCKRPLPARTQLLRLLASSADLLQLGLEFEDIDGDRR